jgi:hypothetical protein
MVDVVIERPKSLTSYAFGIIPNVVSCYRYAFVLMWQANQVVCAQCGGIKVKLLRFYENSIVSTNSIKRTSRHVFVVTTLAGYEYGVSILHFGIRRCILCVACVETMSNWYGVIFSYQATQQIA